VIYRTIAGLGLVRLFVWRFQLEPLFQQQPPAVKVGEAEQLCCLALGCFAAGCERCAMAISTHPGTRHPIHNWGPE
jgi:hypothetical protein